MMTIKLIQEKNQKITKRIIKEEKQVISMVKMMPKAIQEKNQKTKK